MLVYELNWIKYFQFINFPVKSAGWIACMRMVLSVLQASINWWRHLTSKAAASSWLYLQQFIVCLAWQVSTRINQLPPSVCVCGCHLDVSRWLTSFGSLFLSFFLSFARNFLASKTIWALWRDVFNRNFLFLSHCFCWKFSSKWISSKF